MDRQKGRTLTTKRRPCSRLGPNDLAVLVLDDEPSVRMILASGLAAEGYSVSLADGSNAAESLHARQYYLIITDIMMPVIDGLQVLALAKKKSPKAKVIVITGYPSQESLQLCRKFGVERYIVKPFALAEIRQAARNVLRAKKFDQRVLVGDRNN